MSRNPTDAALEAAQREFNSYDAEPAWALKPKEQVCMCCFLVKPCECDDALRPAIPTVTTKAGM